MSCIIMSPEATAALADFLEGTLNMSFEFWGFSTPSSLKEAARDCMVDDGYGPLFSAEKIYKKLYAINTAAYCGRYQDDAAEEAPEIDIRKYHFYRPPEFASLYYAIAPWHYKAHKLLEFWLYQTCEDATIRCPLRLALSDLHSTLESFIVHNSGAWHSFPWGGI